MKKFLMLLVIALTCMSLLSTVAEARRFGGGGSFGKSRAMPTRQAQRAPATAPAPAPASAGNKWMGPLAGLAIGAGLATMFAGGGMGGLGGGMSSILMALLAAGLIMFLISKFKNAQQNKLQYAGGGGTYQPAQPMREQGFSSDAAIANAGNIPQDFPVESFLRNAKMSFIRLQAANDRKDINDVREYTTPEIFAEISMQMQERGNAQQKTEVITIHAELLEVANEGDYSIASVRFTGQLSENNGAPENVDEIWHIQKNLQDAAAAWLLAGIQQTNIQ
ncbi:MAG: Tim44 domain-containing protein [Methylotenera sp.]|nr:Tim44 domain-containing protein [Methylotenera sp.]MSP99961.1 Tim44 domain-containing protein [Methylotenera sp.]